MQSRLRHSSLGMVIGVPFGGGGQSWESYLGSNTNFWTKSRSGNELVDEYGNNAKILFPYYYKPSDSHWASKVDSANLLDIGSSDFTLCGWVKSETSTLGTVRNIMGKYKVAYGAYGFQMSSTTGSIYPIIITGGAGGGTFYPTDFMPDKSSVPFVEATGWIHVLMEIDNVNKKLGFWVNGEQHTVDKDFTGTFSLLAGTDSFRIGSGNTGTASKASFSDVMVFHRLLTPTEKTTIYNRGYVATPTVYFPCTERGYTLYDVGSNGFHLTKVFVTEGYPISYSASGSRYLLDKGYTDIEFAYGKLQVPLKLDGSAQTIVETTQVNIVQNVAGSTTSHNLANSLIEFAGTEWDRSDVARYSSIARSLKYGYDAANPKRWSVDTLNNILFQSWANAGYKKTNFVKISDHSYKDRKNLTEIISCTTDQVDSQYAKAMTYCGDYVFSDTYENDYLYWKMTSNLIRAVNGNKYFAYEAGKVKLSLDNGVTYPYEKAIAGLTTIHMAWIFDNGNILFAALVGGAAKIYYSTDNFANITECTVLDVAGNPYSPVNAKCYIWATSPIYHTIGTKDILAWGTYNVLNKNSIWYSTDYGVTIKQAYLDGTTDPPNINADNIHGIVYTGADKKFWIWHGDGTDKCAVIEGVYDDVADTWSWTKIAGDNDGGSSTSTNYTYYKIGGFIFDSGYVYWVSDSDSPVRKRIYRCLRADFGVTPANYETLFDNGVFLFDFKLFGSDMLTSNLRKTNDEFHWILGLNKTKWYNIPLYNHVITTAYKNQFIFGIDSNGWIVSNAPDYNGSLLTKIK